MALPDIKDYNPWKVRKFKKIKELGKGTFGETIAVIGGHTGREYALKKYTYQDTRTLSAIHDHQLDAMRRYTCAEVVTVHDVWSENGDHVFVLMELCDDNLKNILSLKPHAFARWPDHPLSPAEYYLSWHLLRDLSRALNHLHTQQPRPVTHGNLKPENCLVNHNIYQDNNNHKSGQQLQYVKLSDFGLTEIFDGHRPDPGEDMYSLAVIALQLFGFDIGQNLNRAITAEEWVTWFDYSNPGPGHIYRGTILYDKIQTILHYLRTCILNHYTSRPTCSQFLEEMMSWAISPHHVQQDPGYCHLNEHLASIPDKFFHKYLHYKSARYWEYWIWSPGPGYSVI